MISSFNSNEIKSDFDATSGEWHLGDIWRMFRKRTTGSNPGNGLCGCLRTDISTDMRNARGTCSIDLVVDILIYRITGFGEINVTNNSISRSVISPGYSFLSYFLSIANPLIWRASSRQQFRATSSPIPRLPFPQLVVITAGLISFERLLDPCRSIACRIPRLGSRNRFGHFQNYCRRSVNGPDRRYSAELHCHAGESFHADRVSGQIGDGGTGSSVIGNSRFVVVDPSMHVFFLSAKDL